MKWEQHKRGRVVHALTFTFNQKAEPTPPETQPASPAKSKPKLTREYVQQHAQPGESWEEAWERLRRKPEQPADTHIRR